jgi:hypothetical protein
MVEEFGIQLLKLVNLLIIILLYIDVNVKSIVNNWSSSAFNNNGFIVRQTQSQEFINNFNQQVTLKYFSRDTHTIYPPALQISWFDFNWNTGSSKQTVLNTTIKNIYFDGITKWYNLPEHLSLPYNNNNVTFNFVGVHMQSRNHLKYQYILEGFDNNWSAITNRTEAPYGNLPSGDYTFKVKAMNQIGLWSKECEFKFCVRKPWWESWWFRLVVFGFVTILIYSIYRMRTAKLRKDKIVLEQTVEIRTAEVQNEKNVVEEQKKLIEKKHKEITDSINYAERIQRSLLASKQLLDEYLSQYFILYKPKDIVSGDFYWFSEQDNKKIVVVGDCTGHGVSGALMTMVGASILNEKVLKDHVRENLPNHILI